MPYIKEEVRNEIDEQIQLLIDQLKQVEDNYGITAIDGVINYTVTKILHAMYGASYFNYNRVVGVLGCIDKEFYRRKIAPYEDIKIRENGDVRTAPSVVIDKKLGV